MPSRSRVGPRSTLPSIVEVDGNVDVAPIVDVELRLPDDCPRAFDRPNRVRPSGDVQGQGWGHRQRCRQGQGWGRGRRCPPSLRSTATLTLRPSSTLDFDSQTTVLAHSIARTGCGRAATCKVKGGVIVNDAVKVKGGAEVDVALHR